MTPDGPMLPCQQLPCPGAGAGIPTVLKSLRSARSPLVGWPKKPLPAKTLPETFEPKSVKKHVGPPPIVSA